MSKIGALLHSEIVGIYGGLNAILGAIVALGVHLTDAQIGAVLVIANVVVGPIVRGLVTPTTVRPIAQVAQSTVTNNTTYMQQIKPPTDTAPGLMVTTTTTPLERPPDAAPLAEGV